MNKIKQNDKIKTFVEYWKDKGYEKGESQVFWLSLLRDVLDVEEPEKIIKFEDKVMLDHTSFIDGIIESTHVLIEQKDSSRNLRKAIRQSDGSLLSPFQQAKRYSANLPYSKRPRYIITCNFLSFLIYDMENPQGEPEELLLENLPKEYYRLKFIVNTEDKHIQRELEISIKAGDLVGKLYNALLNQYINPDNINSLKSLNMLCVRLVFCLYAEDAGIFGKHNMFHDYLQSIPKNKIRKAIIDLFKILDTKEEDRDPYLEDDLKIFPYVNGGLFSQEDIEIPQFNDEIIDLLIKDCSEQFDWSMISPTIFGAVFESTLNPQTRRSGGMHYTSIENIHKVIDPLFLDELKAEFAEIKSIKKSIKKLRKQKLKEFQNKLASLTFLDPACGSGNFLTETYLSLRRLENEVLKEILQTEGKGATLAGLITDIHQYNLIKVSISQFYGIEINDFAVNVAKTALWIAENQMMQETENIVHMELDFLPLKTNAYIIEGNALRIDWQDVVAKEKLNYIMGNPPFVGQSMRNNEQSNDMNLIFGKGSIETKLDYVLCWYKKTVDFLINTSNIKVAYVSTNSICQGEAVPTFWKNMIQNGVEIQFAYTSFKWNNEANTKASVYCVIIGFTNYKLSKPKIIYSNKLKKIVEHINAYLYPANDFWIENRVNKKTNNMAKMTTGSPPTDGGNLLLSTEEKEYFIKKYPQLTPYIRPFIGAREFLHDKIGTYSRYCLWLKEAEPNLYRNIKEIMVRLNNVKEIRQKSSATRIQKMAMYPFLFCQDRQPQSSYLVIPRHSSEKRKYIPIGFVDSNVIAGDACSIIPNITLYEFGILTSNVHNAWLKVICGRLKSDYRYSPAVYNNFPWCNPTIEQKNKIENTAQMILNARNLYPNASLADLYDELTMPKELRKAHQENDKAVMEAYGFDWRTMSEVECVAELMKMYQKLTSKNK
ncbi:methylase [Megamonas hypermegale]|uniref:DNA methyltransferase n=1 Tax=Megamonas hypermegale TaxID=158847 RepID=UPI000B3806EE|nr:DNA methyltransferase [Megamonas hypermegale]OUO39421.1 methylase [Megamonas hypermegale]